MAFFVEDVMKGKYERWLEPDGLILIEGWARDGLTEEQIAHNIGINRGTLNEWKKRFPIISNTLKKGKEVVDYEVENALLKRAKGYDYVETIEETYASGKKNKKVLVKHMPPDTVAMIFWLKNRLKGKWKDKPIDEADMKLLTKAAEILEGIDSAID